jgi:hypothetical protein
MTEEKRLKYLIQYHHSLSIQYAALKRHSDNALNQLKKIENEIERLLSI